MKVGEISKLNTLFIFFYFSKHLGGGYVIIEEIIGEMKNEISEAKDDIEGIESLNYARGFQFGKIFAFRKAKKWLEDNQKEV